MIFRVEHVIRFGSGNGTIGDLAAGVRVDVGGDNTHWIAGEGWRQASTVLPALKSRRFRFVFWSNPALKPSVSVSSERCFELVQQSVD